MIAVVVPTNRPEKIAKFKENWSELFMQHRVALYIVHDGETPYVETNDGNYAMGQIMSDMSDLIYNFNDGVRNLGFALAYKQGADIIISLDDDTEPYGDTIQAHIDALNKNYPTSWINTALDDDVYMRGVPYGVREEAECVLSHGTWLGVPDVDASTQLVHKSKRYMNIQTRQMPIPKGVMFPMCIMNVAFKRKMTPYMYQAPMFGDINRFADIWAGIEAKKDIDANGWCAVTGYANVLHERASNPFANLVKEARGIGMNEKYGEDEYFKLFAEKRNRWQEYLKAL